MNRPLQLAHFLIALEVLLLGLNPFAVLVIYFLAHVTEALLNSVRIFIVGIAGDPLGRHVGFGNLGSALLFSLFVIGFFWSKYAPVLFGAGLLVFVLPGLLLGYDDARVLGAAQDALSENGRLILFGSACIGLSQLYDFAFGFVGQRQYRGMRWWTLLLRPYLGLLVSTAVLVCFTLLAIQQTIAAPDRVLGVGLVLAKLATDLGVRRYDRAIGARGAHHGNRESRLAAM